MLPEQVPNDLVAKAMRATVNHGPHTEALIRTAFAAVLPIHEQQATAKYRRFVSAVREIVRGGESLQTPYSRFDGGGDECTISPPELRQALTDLKHERK